MGNQIPRRKVVQIAVSQSEDDNSRTTTVVALCADNTIWSIDLGAIHPRKPTWRRCPPIPQDDDPA